MKNYYYTIPKDNQSWSQTPQHSRQFNSDEEFFNFCAILAVKKDTQIRGCLSPGYNNQGYYIHASHYKNRQYMCMWFEPTYEAQHAIHTFAEIVNDNFAMPEEELCKLLILNVKQTLELEDLLIVRLS